MSFFRKIDRRSLLVAALYLVVTLVFFARFLTGDLVMAFKDLSRYFYPLRQLMVAEVMSGHLPLWNPYLFCGFPLLATLQIGFFYPLTAVYYLLPFGLAFNYYIILHYFLAACFMYAMLRHFKLDYVPAFFGGLIFAFSGYLLSVSNMNTSLSSVVWLPLALLFLDKFLSSSFGFRNSSFVWLTVVLALMFLGGEPTILYTTGWFLFFYVIVFAKEKLKSLLWLVGSAVLAAGLVAVQLVPFIELQRSLSDRLVRTGFDLVSFRSFPPREILTFIFPYFFGNAATFGGYTETLLGKTYQDWLISPYLGILPLTFALFAKRDKLVWFLWGTALVSLVLACGRYTPVYQLIYSFLPGVSLIRYPVKYLFLLTFCLAFLSALGLARLIGFFEDKDKLRSALKFVWPVVLAVLALSLAGQFLLGGIIGFFSRQYSAGIPAIFFKILEELIRFNLHSFFNLTAYLAVFALLLWAAGRGRISQKVFANSLVLIAAADLLANGYTIAVAAPAEVFSVVPPNYSLMMRDRQPERFFYTPELADANRVVLGDNYGEALFNAKDNFTANWPLLGRLFDFSGYESIEPYQLSQFYKNELRENKLAAKLDLLGRWNVKYILAAGPLRSSALKLLRHKNQFGQNLYIYENQRVKPRAYFSQGAGRVDLAAYRPGLLALKTASMAPASLFLSETRYPGWQALVDGRAVKIKPADRFFQAIDLPAGAHEVRFVYDPWSLKLGAGISLLSIVLISTSYFLLSKHGVDDRT